MKLTLTTSAALIVAAVLGCTTDDKRAAVPKNYADTSSTAVDLHQTLSGKPDPAKAAEIITPANNGDTVSIGVFAYTVENVSFCKSIATDAMRETAGGIFLLVKLSFANHDRRPHTLDTSLVRVIDANSTGYRFSAAACDIITMSGKNCLYSKSCRPGETIQGIMIFDVPSEEGEYRLKVSNGAWKESTRYIRLVTTATRSGDRLK